MTEKEDLDKMNINLEEYMSEEKLEKLGYTKETFKGSNLEALLESMIFGSEKTIQNETQRLMKEYSLSYGEARVIATGRVLNSLKTLGGGLINND